MHFLIIGGKKFLGKHIVLKLIEKGHKVTMFNRGNTNPELFSNLENIHGDRNTDLEKLKNMNADVVIDTCAYFPNQVTQLLKTIKNNIKHYILISSVSVYQDFKIRNIDEGYPVGTIEDENIREITGETYGPLKALCEKRALNEFKNVTVIRPGLICGPDDPSDRFTYLPVIMQRSTDVIVPNYNDNIQIIDVRDLALWTIHLAEKSIKGIFNAAGPETPIKMFDFINHCKEIANPAVNINFRDNDFLTGNNIMPWSDLPVWIPAEGDYTGFSDISINRAIANGLQFRDYRETIEDTLNWYNQNFNDKTELKTGLSRQRIQDLLELEK